MRDGRRRWRIALLAGLAAGCGAAQPTARYDATVRHAFDDVEHWRKVFDDPARDRWQKPEEVVRALGIAPGLRVADLGAGTGYFTRHLSRAVGPTGAVYAVEVEPNLVAYLRRRAEQEGWSNTVVVRGAPDDPGLAAGAFDLVLFVDTYHHIDDRLRYMRRLRAALAPAGRIAIVDWFKKKLPVGPPLDHKLARRQVIEEMRAAGFRLTGAPRIVPYQYVLVFEPRRR